MANLKPLLKYVGLNVHSPVVCRRH